MADKFQDGEIVQIEKKGLGSRLKDALTGGLKWGVGGAAVGAVTGGAIGEIPGIIDPLEIATGLTLEVMPDGIADPIIESVRDMNTGVARHIIGAVGGAEIGAAAGATFGAGKGFAEKQELRHLQAQSSEQTR